MPIADYLPLVVFPDVVQLEEKHYEQALKTFIHNCAEELSDDAAFYTFGKIRTPGVSDIDLLLVVRDEEWHKAYKITQSLITSSELFCYLFVHPPIIVSRSIIPHLFYIHSLYHCTYIYGEKDHLAEKDYFDDDVETRLIRHAVWASYMRIAALQLQGPRIGLRKALELMNILLTSALTGNDFLTNRLEINLSTDAIRNDVLSTPPADQEETIRHYIRRTVATLNQVDSLLDDELQERGALNGDREFYIPLSRQRSLISFRWPERKRVRGRETVTRDRQILVPVPAYQVLFAAKLEADMSEAVSGLEVLRPYAKLLGSCAADQHSIQTHEYAEHIKETVRKCSDNAVMYFFLTPFGLALKPRERWDQLRQSGIARWLKTLSLQFIGTAD